MRIRITNDVSHRKEVGSNPRPQVKISVFELKDQSSIAEVVPAPDALSRQPVRTIEEIWRKPNTMVLVILRRKRLQYREGLTGTEIPRFFLK